MANAIKVSVNGTLALTIAEINALQFMLDAHDRAGFYMTYYAMTDSSAAALTASIATFSDNAGGVAYAANRIGQAWGFPGTYPGIYAQSQAVAQAALNGIEVNATGLLTDEQLFQTTVLAWEGSGGRIHFPGNLFGNFSNPFDDLIPYRSFLQDIDTQLLNVDLTAADPFAGFIADMRAKYNPGVLSSLLALFVYDQTQKTTSNTSGSSVSLSGYELRIQNGKVLAVFGSDTADYLVAGGGAGFYIQFGGPINQDIYDAFSSYLMDIIVPTGPFNPGTVRETNPGGPNGGDIQNAAPLGSNASLASIWTAVATNGNDILTTTDQALSMGFKAMT
jgi:hypothetical protein